MGRRPVSLVLSNITASRAVPETFKPQKYLPRLALFKYVVCLSSTTIIQKSTDSTKDILKLTGCVVISALLLNIDSGLCPVKNTITYVISTGSYSITISIANGQSK